MSQRTLAGVIAVPLVIALVVVAWLSPLPYVVYRPGLTVNVLGKTDGKEIIGVVGHPAYRDDGQLRMTTVSVTRPETKVYLPELLGAWFSKKDAVYPWNAVYSKGTSDRQSKQEGAVQMSTSQDTATAVALAELGQKVPEVVKIASVTKGGPADGVLKTGDQVLDVDGLAVTTKNTGDAVKRIRRTPAGQAVEMVISRGGKQQRVSMTPVRENGVPRIGVALGVDYDFPFDVSVNIDPSIGGPSAGLMFSLGIYDTLTPGSLTGGQKVAGTGEIEPDGSVGPIGGIQQKIAASDRDGARLFLVPKDNCDEALGAAKGDVRLVKVTTMHDAVTSVESWVKNHDATLPTCGGKA
ncbi:PDZ domain-containing protein [Nocardioides sp. AN3]